MADLKEVRCPYCNKLLAFVSNEDEKIRYLQLKCGRCKKEICFTNGKIFIK